MRNPPHQRSDVRRLLFFYTITLSLPIIFFLLTEGTLVLIHYGPDISLFYHVWMNGQEYLAMNPSVSSRYFFSTEFAPGSSPDAFLAQKPSNGIRVFCLGASTTAGYPYWYNAAFPSFLKDRLRAEFPDRPVEVVNLGITATNSFAVLDMMRDVVREHPDAIVVYDGHNEFYGALGIASRESLGSSRWLVNLSLRLIHSKAFMLLRNLYGGVVSSSRRAIDERSRATMMERMAASRTISYGSDEYWEGVNIFQKNVEATCSLCRDSGIPLLYCTQVSNLHDLPPFISVRRKGMTTEEQRTFDDTLRLATTLLHQGHLGDADRLFRSLIAIDSQCALARYDYAQCLEQQGQFPEATLHYKRARDFDAVRFRASDDINAVIRSVRPPCFPVDVESSFAANSRHGFPGSDLIMEHLHPSAYGQFLIAKEIAEAMQEHGIIIPREEWTHKERFEDDSLWEHRWVTTLDEIIARRKTEILTAGWPFHSSSLPISEISIDDTLGQISEMVVRGLWSWRHAHEAAGVFYVNKGDFFNAAAETGAIANTFPLDDDAQRQWNEYKTLCSKRK